MILPNFKKQLLFAITIIAVFPTASLAADSACEKLPSALLKTTARAAENAERMSGLYASRIADILKQRTQYDTWLAESRQAEDLQIDAAFRELSDGASSDEEKDATRAFEEAIKSAVKARRLAVDAAQNNLRNGIDNLMIKRKGSLETSIAAYKNETKVSFDRAQEACDTGLKNIREDIERDLGSAQRKFVGWQRGEGAFAKDQQALLAIHEAAIKQATDDFSQKVEKAKNDYTSAHSRE